MKLSVLLYLQFFVEYIFVNRMFYNLSNMGVDM